MYILFFIKKHLQKYIDEFSFRYDSRKYKKGFIYNYFLCNIENRLTYKELIYG